MAQTRIDAGQLAAARGAGPLMTPAELLDIEGVRIPVDRAEDLIVCEAAAWRARGRTGVARLRVTRGAGIDPTHV